jgi:hypothetical protein
MMEQVLDYIEARAAELNGHPLFSWIGSGGASPETRLAAILPGLANFTMGFCDLNRWPLRYSYPEDELRCGINSHTFEDQTHSRLYLEDWRRLDLDGRLGWRASDTLWWLFLAADNEVPRAQGAYLRALAVADGGDPLLRFAHSEVIEACGAVFFTHTAKVAEAMTGGTGIECRYLGPYHLARETGHMDCERLFAAQRLDPARRRQALGLADAMFTLFDDLFSSVLRCARSYTAGRQLTRPAAAQARRRDLVAAEDASGPATLRADTAVHTSQVPLQHLLERRRGQVARHAFYSWLGEAGAAEPLWTLRRFAATWAMEIMGFRDLVWYALRYASPQDELEQQVNDWAADLQTHSGLFLADWQELDLDSLLGWTASETLEFYYLDPLMEAHRRNFITFTELAAAHPDPVLRLWLVEALEETGLDFFAGTAALATTAEAASGLRLDYLAGRHHLAHPLGRPTRRPAFKYRAIDAGTCEVAARMINVAFTVMAEHLDLALEAAITDRFGMTAHQEVPPR